MPQVGKIVTPCFEMDVAAVQRNYAALLHAFDENHVHGKIAYSIKANYHPDILAALQKMGSWFEACTDHEVELLRSYGVPFCRMVVNGYLLKDELLKGCLEQGALVILGSYLYARRVCEMTSKYSLQARLGVRVNLDEIKSKEAGFDSLESRFGIPNSTLLPIQSLLQSAGQKITCLHAHCALNTRAPMIYVGMVQRMSRMVEENHLSSVRMLDIGGGFKTAEEYWTYEDYAAEIFRALHFEKRPSIELMVEPGNSLVRNCCTYRMTVIDVFSLGLRNYVVVDGSSLHLYGPNRQTGCCCEVQYRIMSRKERCILEEQIVVGNTCRETDVILSLHKRPQFWCIYA